MTGYPTDLICTRIADMFVMHPEQIERQCHKCGHAVGVYPTGQRAMANYPKMKITCSVCMQMTPLELVTETFPAGSMEEIIREKHESKRVK